MFTVKIKKLMSHAEDESERLHTAFDSKESHAGKKWEDEDHVQVGQLKLQQ